MKKFTFLILIVLVFYSKAYSVTIHGNGNVCPGGQETYVAQEPPLAIIADGDYHWWYVDGGKFEDGSNSIIVDINDDRQTSVIIIWDDVSKKGKISVNTLASLSTNDDMDINVGPQSPVISSSDIYSMCSTLPLSATSENSTSIYWSVSNGTISPSSGSNVIFYPATSDHVTVYTYSINSNCNATSPTSQKNLGALSPSDLHIVNVGYREITLAWNPPAVYNGLGFNIYKNDVLIQTIPYSPTPSAVITGLVPDYYRFEVSNCGEYDKSNTLYYCNWLPSIPSVPLNLNWHYWGSSYVLTWNTPTDGIVAGYNVYQIYPTSWKQTTTNTSLGLGSLSYNQMYVYHVTAFDSYGNESPYASTGFGTYSSSASLLKNAPSDSLLVNNNHKADFFINPLDNKLWVEGIYDFDISITDMTGKELLTLHNVNGNIDISSFKPGVYVIQIKSGANFFVKKVVKQ